LAALRIDLVGTTADFRRPGPQRSLPINHLASENRGTAGRIGEVRLTPHQRREAIKRRDQGDESLADIGRSYNVSAATISRLR
jgi:Helix-turn-helix domain